jgi:prevent-host-death family protein
MTTVNLGEAKAMLAALVDRAAAGEEIILARAGKPVARLTALPAKEPRQSGVAAHWRIDTIELLAPTDPEDLDGSEGRQSDSLGITAPPKPWGR